MKPAIIKYENNFYNVIATTGEYYIVNKLNKNLDSIDKRVKYSKQVPINECVVIGYANNE